MALEVFGNFVRKLYDEDPLVQEEAIVSLVTAATQVENRWEMPDFPDALARIASLLFQEQLPGRLQEYAAWALGNLSCGHVPADNKQKMANFPQVLPGLVRLLLLGSGENGKRLPTGTSRAQEEAVRALRNLACAQENNSTISLFPNAFPALLKLLFDRNSSPGVQVQATMAVLNLIGNAMASREGIGNGITASAATAANSQVLEQGLANCKSPPDALECLVMLWFSDASSRVKAQATSAIMDLVERTLVNPDFVAAEDASQNSGNMQQIADFPDALLRLLRSLFVQSSVGEFPNKERKLNYRRP